MLLQIVRFITKKTKMFLASLLNSLCRQGFIQEFIPGGGCIRTGGHTQGLIKEKREGGHESLGTKVPQWGPESVK